MICKVIKYGVLTLAGGALITSLLLGSEALSYVRSSARSVRMAVKDNIPVEFELRRARDLLDDILPEMQANVRLIAQQEVEISSLQDEIKAAHQSLDNERTKLAKLRNCLSTQDVSFTMNGINYSRDDVKRELARKLELVREAEVVLSGKDRLLENRQKSLAAAMQVLEQRGLPLAP